MTEHPESEEVERLRTENAAWQDRCLRYQTALQVIALITYEDAIGDVRISNAAMLARRALEEPR